jgi:hypothetical protein
LQFTVNRLALSRFESYARPGREGRGVLDGLYVAERYVQPYSMGQILKDASAHPTARILIHEPDGNRPFALDSHSFFVITKTFRRHRQPPAAKGADRAETA